VPGWLRSRWVSAMEFSMSVFADHRQETYSSDCFMYYHSQIMRLSSTMTYAEENMS
jgi:hypothetical protein